MELKAPTLNDLKGLVLTALAAVLLWNYILFFLEPATEMVIQIARSIILPSGLESNEAYYPLETTVKYIGGIMLISFILVQNEVKNVLNPGAFVNLLIDTVRSPANAAGNWRDAYRSAVARIADWESYITTLVGIVVFYIILLWSASADLSPRSQAPFLIIGGSILTGFLLLQNELKTLIVGIIRMLINPREAVKNWRGSWAAGPMAVVKTVASVITTIVAIGIFLFIFLNAVFLPDLTQNFPTVLSAAMLVIILVWWKLMAMEMAKPAVAAKRSAAMAFLLAIPLILYLVLRLMVLLKTDQSWDITLVFMQAKAGFNISNWPDQIDIANASRWEFYRAGIVNAVRAVLASMLLCTILGFIVGVTRLSSNKLASGLATVYVEIFRNFPFAVLLFVISSVMGQSLPQFREEVDIMDKIGRAHV